MGLILAQLTQPINQTANANRNVTLFWCDKYGDNKNCAGGKTNTALPVKKISDDPNISPITLNMGLYFINYNFVVPIDTTASITKFWFEVNENDGSNPTTYDNEGNGFVIDQDQVLFVPMLSHVDIVQNSTTNAQTYTNRVGDGFTRNYNLVVAVRDGTNPSKVSADATDLAMQGFAFPIHTQVEFNQDSSIPSQSGYSFYSAKVQSAGVQLTLDVHAEASGQTYTQDFMQTQELDNTPYVKPGPVSVTTKTKSAAGKMLVPNGFAALALLLFGTVFARL